MKTAALQAAMAVLEIGQSTTATIRRECNYVGGLLWRLNRRSLRRYTWRYTFGTNGTAVEVTRIADAARPTSTRFKRSLKWQ